MTSIIAQQTKHDLELVPKENRLDIGKYFDAFFEEALVKVASQGLSRAFKKASSYKKESEIVLGVKKKGKRKEKEKVDVAHGKGIELLSEVALSEKSQMKESRKKSLRDFHKTHPSGPGTVVEKLLSVEKITPIVTRNDEDDSNNEQESSDESKEEGFDQENKSEDDEMKSDEEQRMDDITDQFDDDADARLEEPTETAIGIIQGEGNDTEMTEDQQGNENLETTQEQVVEDAHVTISTIPKKTEVPVTKIVSPLDVYVHHEVPRTQAPTLLTIPVSVILESSPIFTNIPQSSYTFTSTPIQATPTPPPTIETTNPLSNLLDFSLVFRFNDRITALEKEVSDLKKDPQHTQVTSLVDSHLDTRLGETREEFMNFLLESLTARIKEQVKDQLPQILPQEVSNFAPPVIEKLIKESRDEVTLAKVYSQPQSTYEAASTLIESKLKKILLDKREKSESYLTAPEHRDCYDGLKKSYALDKDFFYSYDVYSLKCGRKDKDKDEDPSAGSDRGLKKRKTSKDAEPTTGPKKKYSMSDSSKGTKSQSKYSGKSV
ncbi:hypothetical protein Tco_0617491 [Tanacetum coccineum]